jgi:aspartate aminotransferase
VVLIKPYWPAYTQMLSMLKLESFTIDLDKLNTIKDIKTDSKTKILLFDLPHNPSGKVFTKKELLDLIAFAKNNNLFIIADESYEKLIYDGEQRSLVTLDKTMKENIMTIFSVSQSFSMMGWRLGYAAANKNIISAMEAVQSSITAATPYISQTSVTAIINNTSYSKDLVTKFKKRRDSIYTKLKDIDGITVELPESGPYFWCDIKKITKNSLDFSEKFLKKEKIAIMPGEPFGTPGWIRIAFNVHEIPVLEDAVSRLASFIKTYEKN